MASEKAAKILKRELRLRVRATLRALPATDVAAQGAALCARVAETAAYASAQSVAVYASLPGEVDTAPLLSRAVSDGKRLFLPRVVDKATHSMAMLEVRAGEDYRGFPRSDWDICEPPLDGRAQAPQDAALDLVVVPGVAFDRLGGRLGQGMGFYDTFFARYHASGRDMPALVAMALPAQIVESVPMTDADWRVDTVLVAGED